MKEKKELPEGWRWGELGDLLNECYRYPSYYNIDYIEKGVPEVRGELLLETGEIEKNLSKFRFISEDTARKFPKVRLIEGDIVMTVRGTIGKIGIVPHYIEGGVITANLIRLSPNKQVINPRYIWHYFKSPIFHMMLNQVSSHTTIKTIKAPLLQKIKILLPPLPIQQKIVDKLDKQMAQIEMMKKESERQIESRLGLLESTLSYYLNDETIKTGKVFEFSRICELDKNPIYPKSEEAKKLTYIGMEDIEADTGVIKINPEIRWDSISSNTFYFNTNHVLYGKLRPYLNKVALPDFDGRCSTELIPFLPQENCRRKYLAYLLRRPETIHAAMKNKTGSRMPRADLRGILKLRIKLPDLKEQDEIITKIESHNLLVTDIRTQIEKQQTAINQLPFSILNEVFGQYEIPGEA